MLGASVTHCLEGQRQIHCLFVSNIGTVITVYMYISRAYMSVVQVLVLNFVWLPVQKFTTRGCI